MFDIIPLELVRFRNSRYSVSSRSFSCPALPFLLSFSYSNVKVENNLGVFRPFPTVFILKFDKDVANDNKDEVIVLIWTHMVTFFLN